MQLLRKAWTTNRTGTYGGLMKPHPGALHKYRGCAERGWLEHKRVLVQHAMAGAPAVAGYVDAKIGLEVQALRVVRADERPLAAVEASCDHRRQISHCCCGSA